jgi:hypothetical protein
MRGIISNPKARPINTTLMAENTTVKTYDIYIEPQ